MRPITLSLVLFLFAGLAEAGTRHGQEASSLSDEQQSKVLEEAVQILGGNANIAIRWNSDVVFSIVGGNRYAKKVVRDTIIEVSGIATLPVQELVHDVASASQYLQNVMSTPTFQLDVCTDEASSICSNFVIIFTDNKTMFSLAGALPLRDLYARSLKNAIDSAESIPCFFSPFRIKNAEIFQSLVYVNEELDDELLATCIREEIYQSFGLFADVTDSAYFSFDNRVMPKEITPYDKALLKALYNPALSPGAPVFSVLKIFMEDLAFDLYNEPVGEN